MNNKNNKYPFEINMDEIKNMVIDYADALHWYEVYSNRADCVDDDSVEQMNYEEGYINASEAWLKALQIHPKSSFVANIIEKRNKMWEEEFQRRIDMPEKIKEKTVVQISFDILLDENEWYEDLIENDSIKDLELFNSKILGVDSYDMTETYKQYLKDL